MRLALNKEWAVGARIGGGGFGAVFEAEDTAGEKAAVKLVPKAPGTEREMLFIDLDGVRNVVPVIDSGEHEDQWVLVMPRAEKSLRDHLQEHGQLPLNEAVAVLSDVAEALADLKDREIVHRDLKPENILLLGDRWCLADFGIARYAEATTVKHTFKLHGTFAYMAPERWNNQRATSASDIYALGVLAYELLEGTPPFTGPYEHDYHDQHLHGALPPLTTAPPLLAALITECLFRAPQGRPAATCSPGWGRSPRPRSPAGWPHWRRPTRARSRAKPKLTAGLPHTPPRPTAVRPCSVPPRPPSPSSPTQSSRPSRQLPRARRSARATREGGPSGSTTPS
ncbi:serine/threonine-protein kinase [Streptomyces griseoaurantiacus]|uniref:serine/threonine-protein kinase n=1 Tax=Streptomyces griseoaurantiacus TaxID=68213 RepID=UPI0030E58166